MKLCINKIKKDINHQLWLPTELWDLVMNFFKISIETFTTGSKDEYINAPDQEKYYGENRSHQYTTLYELEAYKQELLIIQCKKSIKKPINNKFKKYINIKKQKRIDNYQRKIYAY